MTATFLLPFAVGACSAVYGGNIVTDAYGLVALVAMTPLIAIQILGLIYQIKQKRMARVSEEAEVEQIIIETVDDDIIEM